MRRLSIIVMALMVAAVSLAAFSLDHAGILEESATDAEEPVVVQAGTWADLQNQINSAQGLTRIILTEDIDGPGDSGLTIEGKSVEIDLNSHVIDAKRAEPGFRGGVICINYGSIVKIYDSGNGGAITGGKAERGGGIYMEDATQVTLEGIAIRGNEATAEGGAIYCSGSNTSTGALAITDCWIDNNVAAGNGGGIANYGSLDINGETLIESNQSRASGGGVYSAGNMSLNSGGISFNTAAANGGGIASCGGSLAIHDGNLLENKAMAGRGGAVYAWFGDNSSTGELYLYGGTIAGNSAAEFGGGISTCCRTMASGTITVNENSCSNNIGNNLLLYGTVLGIGEIDDDSVIDINGAGDNQRLTFGLWDSGTSEKVFTCKEDSEHFVFNGIDYWHTMDVIYFDINGRSGDDLRSTVEGGAEGGLRKVILQGDGASIHTSKKMYVEDGRNVVLDTNGNTIYRDNDGNKESNGHVVEVRDGTLFTLMDSKYEEGDENYKGGIYDGNAKHGGGFNIGGDCTLIVRSGYIADNRGGDGGAIYCYGRLIMTGGTVINNEATDAGGAIYLDDDNGSAYIRNVKFKDNWGDEAGAIYFEGPGTLIDCNFDHNVAKDGCGGAIIIDEGAHVVIENTKIQNGESDEDGGAIFLKDGELKLTGCLIDNNVSVHGGGGALIMRKGCSAEIRDCNISFNSAGFKDEDNQYDGGAVYNRGNLSVWDSYIEHNQAGNLGGGIYAEDGHTSVTNTNMEGNKAYRHGGCFYMKKTEVILDNVQMNGCTAMIRNGGAVYMDEDSSLEMKDVIISKSKALEYGGAICMTDDADEISIAGNMYMKDNQAANGSSVYLPNGKKITIAGPLTEGSTMQIDLESTKGVFTKGYSEHNPEVDPSTFFFAIAPLGAKLVDGEASIELDTGYEGADYFIPKKDQIVLDRTRIDSRNWMAGVSGERQLNEINLMGTNESATKKLNDDFCDNIQWFSTSAYKHQTYTIPEQLDMGVRMIEVCLTNQYMTWGFFKDSNHDDKENLWLIEYTFDGLFYCKGPDKGGDFLSLATVLGWVKEFLTNHPSETIIIDVQFNHKGSFDKTMDRLAGILTGLAEEKNPSTGEPFLMFHEEYGPLAKITSYPLLKDCRGKIVIIAEEDRIQNKIGGMDPTQIGAKVEKNAAPNILSHPIDGILERTTAYESYELTEFYLKHFDLDIPTTAEHRPSEPVNKNIAYVIHSNVDHDLFKHPLEAAKYVNLLYLYDGPVFLIPGKYRGMIWVDGVEPDIAYASWNSNYRVLNHHCDITVYPGLPGFDVQQYALLKETKITVPGNIYQSMTDFKGWLVADESGVQTITAEQIAAGATYTITGDVTFTAIWDTSDRAPVQVIWADGGDADDLRPDKIEVEFMDGQEMVGREYAERSNGWLLWYSKDRQVTNIRPVWEGHVADEPVEDGWHGVDGDGTYQYKYIGNNESGYSLTLRHSPTVQVKVSWLGDEEADRPESVTVYLMDGGYLAGTGVATAASGWKCAIKATGSSGDVLIQYTATIAPVDGYSVHSIATTVIATKSTSNDNVLVLWDDGRNEANHRPNKITLNYDAKSTDVYSPEATKSWSYAHIDYTGDAVGLVVSEIEGYTTTVEKVGEVYVIKNSWTAVTVDFKIYWTDEDNDPVVRPDDVRLNFMPGNDFTLPDGESVTFTYKTLKGVEIAPAHMHNQPGGLYIVEATFDAPSKPYHNATFSSVFQVRDEGADSTSYRVSMPGWTQGDYNANVNVLNITYDDGITAYKHPLGVQPEINYFRYSGVYHPELVPGPSNDLKPGLYLAVVSYPAADTYPPLTVKTLFQVMPLNPDPEAHVVPTESLVYTVHMPGWVHGGYDADVNKATAIGVDGNPFVHPYGEAPIVTYWRWNDAGELVQMVPGTGEGEVDFNTLAPGTYLAQIMYQICHVYESPELIATVLFQVAPDYGNNLAFELHMPSWVNGEYSASVNKPYLTGSDGSNMYIHPNGISPTFTYTDMAGNPVTPSNDLAAGVYRVTASYAADGRYPAMTVSTVFEVRASEASPSLAFEINMPGWKAGDYVSEYNAAKLIDTDSISYTIPRAELGVYSQGGKLDVTGHVPVDMTYTNTMSMTIGEVPGYNASIVKSGTLFQIQLSPASTVDEVAGLIDAIGTVAYTAESEGRINAARSAFIDLPLDQRSSVENKDKLVGAINAFSYLKSDYSKVLAVEQSINNAYESEEGKITLVPFARGFYNAIGEGLQPLVSNYYLLLKMEHDLEPEEHPDFDEDIVFQANILGWEEGCFNATLNQPYLTQLGSYEAPYAHPDGLQPTYRYYRSDRAEVVLSNDLGPGRYYVAASFEASGSHPAASSIRFFIVTPRSEDLDCQIVMENWRAGSYNGQLPSMVDVHGKAYTHPDGIEPVFTYWTADGQEVAADKLGELTVGTYTVKATYDQTENYPAFTVSASFKVTTNSDAGLAFKLRMPGWVYGQYDEDDNSPFLISMDGRSSYLHPAALTPSYSFKTLDGTADVTPSADLPAGIYRVTASFVAVEGLYPAISVTTLFQVKEDSSEDIRVFEVMMPGWAFGKYDEDLNVAKAIYPDGTPFDHPGIKTVSYTTVDGTGEVTPGNPMNTGVYRAIISYAESGTWPAMSVSALFEVSLNYLDLPAIAVIMPGWVKGYYSESYNKPSMYYGLGGLFTHPNGIQPQFTYSNLDGTPIAQDQLKDLEVGSYNVTATYPASGQFEGASTTSKFSVTEQGTLMFLVDMSGWEYGGYNGQVAKPVCMDRITPFVHPKGVQPIIVYMDLEMREYTNLEELTPGTYVASITYLAADPYPQCHAQKIFSVTSSAPTDILVCKVSMDSWEVGHFHGKAPTIKDQNGKPFVHPDGIQPIILYGDMSGNPVELSNDLPVGNYSVTVIYILSEHYYPVSDTSYFRVYDPEKEPTLIYPKDISASFDSDRYDGERKTVKVTVGELVRDTDFTVRVLQEGITAIPIDSDYYDVMVILTNPDYMFEVDGKMVPCYTISMKINRGINEITDLKIRGWTVGSEPNKPVVTALFGADTVEFTYSSSELEGFVPEVPEEAGRWYVRAVIGGTDNYTFAAETVSFVISPDRPPVDPTIVIVNPDGSITREIIETTVDPDGTETVTVDAVTTYPDGKYVESHSVTVSKDGESTMTEVSKIRSAEGTWSLEATIETERPFGPNITTTVTSDDGVGYAVSEALISGVQGWFVGGEEVKMALDQSQATVDLLGISGPVQWRIGLHTGSVVAANITSDSMAEIADKDANFVIRSDEGAVVYDNDALDTLASLKKDVSFEMRVDDPSTINHVQQMAIGDGHYVYVSTTVDGRYVTDLGGGTLSITIPFDEELDERSVVKAFYVDRDGHLEEVESRYSADSKTVTIITGHHSIYTLQVEELPMIVLGYGSLTLMVISAMAAAVLIASGYVIRTKKI